MNPALASLHAAASTEGAVELGGSSKADLQWIPAAFNKSFPGIKVNVRVLLNGMTQDGPNVTKTRDRVDVVWNPELLIKQLADEGQLAAIQWRQHGLKAEDIGAGGYMAITSSVASAIVYRRDHVPESDVPRAWEQLLGENYNSKMLANRRLFAYLVAGLAAFEGEAKWLPFARTFTEQTQVQWTANLEKAGVGGERPYIVAVPSHVADIWKARGIPVESTLPEPVFIARSGSAVMRDSPHPNAALLLSVWLTSPEGRAARERAVHSVDLRPSSDDPKAVELRKSGKRVYEDTEATLDMRARLGAKMTMIVMKDAQRKWQGKDQRQGQAPFEMQDI